MVNEFNEFDDFGDGDADEKPIFAIDTDAKADRAIRKIQEAENEYEKWKDFYNNRLEQAKQRKERDIAGLTARLRLYFETVPHRAAKASESYTLPTGKLQMKFAAEELKNNDGLLEFLKKSNLKEFIKVETVETARWGDFKKTLSIIDGAVVTADGLVVDSGVAIHYKPEEFKAVIN